MGQDENKQMQCPSQADKFVEDRKCQSPKSVNMWQKKPQMDVWLKKLAPAMKSSKKINWISKGQELSSYNK